MRAEDVVSASGKPCDFVAAFCLFEVQLHCMSVLVIRLGTKEAEGLSKSDVAKRMKVTDMCFKYFEI